MSKLKVGDRFPELIVDTAYEKDTPIYSLLGGKTVLWFLRYIGCPPCHVDLQTAVDRYDEVTEKGAKIIFAMQSDQEHIAMHYPKGSIPLDVICDPDQKIYKELEILPAASMEALLGNGMEKLKVKGKRAQELGYSHGDYEGNEQQLPAMFILDKSGMIVFAKYAEDIADLPDLDEVLKML